MEENRPFQGGTAFPKRQDKYPYPPTCNQRGCTFGNPFAPAQRSVDVMDLKQMVYI
jgi:hypothetical protein